jgi:hypothetical protein
MTSLTRKTCTPDRIRGIVVAVAALLLPALLLTQAETATALPPITVYHSLDPLGADPRSETVPPGCDEVAGGSGGWVVVVADVNALDNPVFYTNVLQGGTNVLAARNVNFEHFPTLIALYDSLSPDWDVTQNNATITPGDLTDVDLLMFNQNGFDQALVYTQGEIDAINSFVANGGNVLLVIETFQHYVNFNAFLTAIGSSIQFIPDVRVSGATDVVSGAPFTNGMGTIFNNIVHNTLTGGMPVAQRQSDVVPIAAAEQVGSGAPMVECVLGGGNYEELKLWIDGGPTQSGEGEGLCSQDFDSGEGIVQGGSGDEICGAALIFQIEGIGRFRGAIEAPVEVDPGIDTMVLGTVCSPGEVDCSFPPDLKQLTLNFTTGLAYPDVGPRFLGSLIIDSSQGTGNSTISVFGNAAGAELQLRPVASGVAPETIATIPEPGQLVQLLSGLFGLAGLNRLRRKP